jgi:hypothetical protein
MKRFILLCITGLIINSLLFSQEEAVIKESKESFSVVEPTLNLGADFMSRYIWRGYDFGNSPAIQPNIYFEWKGFTLGTWGSYAISGYRTQVNDSTLKEMGHYGEIDLYVSYTFKWFTLLVYDYYVVNGLSPNSGNYFNYHNSTTGHTFEASLIFEGPEKFPLHFLASTLLYGADKGKDSLGVYGMGETNNYSTYFELGYEFFFRRISLNLKPFVGGTPFGSSWYGPKAGIINAGLLVKKEIPVTSQYSIPVQASLVFNPMAQTAFLVFGFSL